MQPRSDLVRRLKRPAIDVHQLREVPDDEEIADELKKLEN